MARVFDNFAVWIVDHRMVVLPIVAAITVVAALGYYDPDLLPSLVRRDLSVPQNAIDDSDTSEARQENEDDTPLRPARSDVVIVVRSLEFFTPDGARAMRQVVTDLEALASVDEVLWMDRVPVLNIFGLREPLFPRSDASERQFESARDKALKHPLVVGQLLSADAETLLLMLTLDFHHVLSDSDATTLLRETAESAAAGFPDFDVSFQVTGRIPSHLAAVASHESNRLKYQLIGFGMIGLMSLILFRGLRAVMIVAAAPALGVFWTIGIIQYLDYGYENGLVDVILPILVALVGVTDGVHMMVQIRRLRAAGRPEREAAREGVRQTGLACFLTSLTTAIGFGSLTFAESEFVRDFGVCCVIGVTLCFIAVISVIPAACSTRLGRNIHQGLDRSLIDQNLGRISVVIEFVLRHREALSITGILATVILFAVSMTLEPDERIRDGLPPAAESTQALMHLDQALGGLESAHIEIRWSDAVPIDSPDVLLAVTAVDDALRSEPLIGHPLSIRSLIEAQPGSGPPAERMSLLNLLPPPLKRAFIIPEERKTIVTFRVQDLGIARYSAVFRRLEAVFGRLEQQYPEFSFSLEGSAVRRWRTLYQIVVDLATSLGTASVIIFAVLAIVFRSLRLGLISIVPNIFPLVVSGTYLALAGFNLEVVMVCCFTVCLGIAVDDTIHFLTRFREEQSRTSNLDDAIRQAFTGVGSALIMTTIVLVAGFATVMVSESRDHRIFATMGTLTISAALFGDLVFLPPLLSLFAPRRTSDTRQPDTQTDDEQSVPEIPLSLPR